MSTITVRLNEDEKRVFDEYAKLQNKPLSTILKESLIEKIEDEIDLKAILEYEKSLKDNEIEYVSFDEVKKNYKYNMRYQIVFNKKADKQLRKIDVTQQRIIVNWIDRNLKNIDNPKRFDKTLKGNLKDYWRYRVGDYRIIAEINNDEIIILIIHIGHRKDIYK